MSELEKGYAKRYVVLQCGLCAGLRIYASLLRFYEQQSSYLRSAVLDFLPEHMRGLEDEGQAGASGGMGKQPSQGSIYQLF